jgi:type I restriction enzyme R subunit
MLASSFGDNVNLILKQIEYEFRRKGSEELSIYNNDLHDNYVKVMQEFDRNYDQKEPAFVNLIEEFKRFLREKEIKPKDVSDYKFKIGYMDEVMKKIREINRANDNLKSKYNQDERFVRIHKRIVEENAKRIYTKARPIISDKEYAIVDGLKRLKEWIDRMIFFKQDILKNEAAFNQDVLAEVSKKLFEFNITADINDRKFIQRSIANEYYAQYNQIIHNTQRI